MRLFIRYRQKFTFVIFCVFLLLFLCSTWLHDHKTFELWLYDHYKPWQTDGPPSWWKIWKIVQKLFLIAQKKGIDALNATQKTPQLFTNYGFWKNQEKPFKKDYILGSYKLLITSYNGLFFKFFLIFSMVYSWQQQKTHTWDTESLKWCG